MKLRSLLGSLQLPVAGLGALLLVMSLTSLARLSAQPTEGDGFVQGLAMLALYVFAWGGVVLVATGLAIPPLGGYGITFNRYQRGLFVVAAIAAVASGVGPFVAFGLLYSNPSLLVNSLLGLMGVAVLGLAGGLCWRTGEAVHARVGDDGGSVPTTGR